MSEASEETALDGIAYLSETEELEAALEGRETKEVAGLLLGLLQKLVTASSCTSRILPLLSALHYNILASFFPACTPALVGFVAAAASPADSLAIVKILQKVQSSMAAFAEPAVQILMLVEPPESHEDADELARRCFDCLMLYVSKVRARPTGTLR